MTVTVYLKTDNLLKDLEAVETILSKEDRDSIYELRYDFNLEVYRNHVEGSVAINVTLEELNKIDLFRFIL